MSQKTCLKPVPTVPRVMDKGTIKNLSLLSFPICEKGFLFAFLQIEAFSKKKGEAYEKRKIMD